MDSPSTLVNNNVNQEWRIRKESLYLGVTLLNNKNFNRTDFLLSQQLKRLKQFNSLKIVYKIFTEKVLSFILVTSHYNIDFETLDYYLFKSLPNFFMMQILIP